MFASARLSQYLANAPVPVRTAKTVTLGAWDTFDTSIYKFASASMYVGAGYPTGPQYKQTYTEASSDFVFGTGDFCVECWFYPTFYSVPDNRLILGLNNNFANNNDPSGLTGSWFNFAAQFLDNLQGNYWFYPSGGSVGAITHDYGSAVYTANAWNHIAFTRSGTTFRSFANGTLIGTTTGHSVDYVQTGSANSSAIRTWVGGTPDIGEVRWGGYIDEVRITKGQAIYTSSFTPTGPLVNTSGTVLLLHLNGNVTDDNTST
jgi:hypothetical protein